MAFIRNCSVRYKPCHLFFLQESIVIDSAKAVAREEEEHEEQEEQATLSVDHEETRSDGPTMDLLVIEDLSVNQLRESIDEIQEQPEIASITSPLPLQSSPSLNNKLITEKPEISQLNHMDFFSVLSTSKQVGSDVNIFRFIRLSHSKKIVFGKGLSIN